MRTSESKKEQESASQVQEQAPSKALNKAYLKIKPRRVEFDKFNNALKHLLNSIEEKESEEFNKNLVGGFLNSAFYAPNYYINTKGRSDLVIHNGKTPKTPVGAIIEFKKPNTKGDMPQKENLNSKAFQELLLYYLRERITLKNLEIRHLIITDAYRWFVFDANVFEKAFAENKQLVKQFLDFEEGRLAGNSTDFFYREIADVAIEKALSSEASHKIEYIYFDLRDYQRLLEEDNGTKIGKLIALFKFFSPEHLLKLPFINDNNSLDKKFYSELLHIIGLEEKKDKGKKIISRKPEGERDDGSIIENTISQIEATDKLSRLQTPSLYGANTEERLFNVALELSITWVNRVLFLKLLEAQLISYHKGDSGYSFLNSQKLGNFDDLNNLFFQALAVIPEKRKGSIKSDFKNVPYLNSSLFEPTELEHQCFFISGLTENLKLPVANDTVLKGRDAKKTTGELKTLEYLFRFLDSYDFSSDGIEEIQDENKTLISAAVLGLIFEKINGYRDGSFFTPGFITMFMCRETMRRAVIDAFNKAKGWSCQNISDVHNKIEDLKEANEIINSIKICDPAVGSGHFLVSALNEILAIKSDLKILTDRNGRVLRNYHVEVSNDELVVTDEDGKIFQYNPLNKESQRIQEALFHEKQTIIENCLFGVDINTNSVKICRLRLWIELLKNAYYKSSAPTELETLPNIDINIKCGNSLIARFPLDADLAQALKKSKIAIKSYKQAVQSYRHAMSKEQKREMVELINSIKHNFRSEISSNDPKVRKLSSKKEELNKLLNQHVLFERSKTEQKAYEKTLTGLKADVQKREDEIKEILSNKIFETAFEWRFEFPEVLSDDGSFAGFDVVIANPPYIYRKADIEKAKSFFDEVYFNDEGNYDLYKFFIEKSLGILKPNGLACLITNSSFLIQTTFKKTREFLLKEKLMLLAPLGPNVFEEATVDTAITLVKKAAEESQIEILVPASPKEIAKTEPYKINSQRFHSNENLVFDYLLDEKAYPIVQRLFSQFPTIESGFEFGVGINTGYIKDQLCASKKLDSRYHPMIPGTGISRYGAAIPHGFIMYDKEFVRQQGDRGRALPEEKFFKLPKILVVRTRNLTLKRRIIATIDSSEGYNLNRLSNIVAREGFNLHGLLGILNSTLFNWIYSTRFYDYEIKPVYLRQSPLAETNNPKLIKAVKERLNLTGSKALQCDEQIDEIVYKLYGLTADEIELIKDAQKGLFETEEADLDDSADTENE